MDYLKFGDCSLTQNMREYVYFDRFVYMGLATHLSGRANSFRVAIDLFTFDSVSR